MQHIGIPEVAKTLGLSEMQIYRMLKRGELPGVKLGQKWYIPQDRFQEWINKKFEEQKTETE